MNAPDGEPVSCNDLSLLSFFFDSASVNLSRRLVRLRESPSLSATDIAAEAASGTGAGIRTGVIDAGMLAAGWGSVSSLLGGARLPESVRTARDTAGGWVSDV